MPVPACLRGRRRVLAVCHEALDNGVVVVAHLGDGRESGGRAQGVGEDEEVLCVLVVVDVQ